MPQVTAADGTRLWYEDEGEGIPVLALAGLTRAGTDFDWVAPHLEGTRLIRLDYRGRGRSEHADWQSYTLAQEAQDVLALLDHLGLERVGVLGTSRGGLVAMMLAATAKERLRGVALNDVGPVIAPEGLAAIEGYLGRRPAQKTLAAAAEARAKASPEFRDVPEERWLGEAERHYRETEDGLELRYDPALRDAFLAAGESKEPAPDPWPLFDALEGLPLALLRGDASNILSEETAAEMRRRRPDMIYREVSGRGHVPFLDEPEALEALHLWLKDLK